MTRPTMSDSVAPVQFPGSEKALIGVYIEDISTGEVVAEYGADRAFCPASIMKAVTSASVMSLYPDDMCFSTRICMSGEVREGILEGDIIVEASGDPTLASSYFTNQTAPQDSLAAALRRLGVDTVAGSIVVDGRALPDPSYPAGWSISDYMWPYGAMLRPLNWRDNRYTLILPSKATEPFIPGLKVEFTRKRRGKMSYDAKPPLTLVKAWGKLPKGGASEILAMPDPQEAFIHAMIGAMADSGIVIGDTPLAKKGEAREITAIKSPTFTAILRSLMHRSDNLMAEGMLRTIAPRQRRDTAATRETDLWKLRGADLDSVRIVDGSGLSRLNRLTPWFLADVLTWMARSPKGEEYATLFPRVGREGTVRRFLADTPLEGQLALKTGTMSGIRALAGYKLGPDGKPTHAIVLIVNGFGCPSSAINKAAERFFLNFFS
ncbi:MAG: D-alanyl-D-alanine carboxypeptidase/D-alanyl-D-alanine-endopeptidase [Pseudoflavonifractor sp.]|nr:D-alanyl-D-alanine carboxypeptidase/D-alanyl-D-alanine-endopeptidase [Pseudoflavonifractor sp.]